MGSTNYAEGVAFLQGRWFDFSVEPPTDEDYGAIWLEDRDAQEQW